MRLSLIITTTRGPTDAVGPWHPPVGDRWMHVAMTPNHKPLQEVG